MKDKNKRDKNRAGYLKSDGYRYVKINGIEYYEHDIIWKMLTGKDPVGTIIHINGKTNDNRIENLLDQV